MTIISSPLQVNPLCTSHFSGMQAVDLVTCARIGILGGTFDPIHYGHLAIAEEARVRYALDAVLFIPAGEPPHKPRWQADAEQRLLMTELATADHPAFFVSRLEIDRPGPSYSVDTLCQLHALYPNAELFFIIGADSALEFASWREPRAILELAHVVAATRPGFPLERLQQEQTSRLEIMPVPGLDISSTDLRHRVRAGERLRYLTPDAVAGFIEKEGLYTK